MGQNRLLTGPGPQNPPLQHLLKRIPNRKKYFIYKIFRVSSVSKLRKKIVIKKKHQSTVNNWSMKAKGREITIEKKNLWWLIEYEIFLSTLATLKSIKYYVLYWTYFFFYHIKYILLICASTSQNIGKCKKLF